MCRTKMAIQATEPTRAAGTPSTAAIATHRRHSPPTPRLRKFPPSNPDPLPLTSSNTSSAAYNTSTSSYKLPPSQTSVSSGASLSSLRDTLPESPIVYDFSELRSATNNFLSRRHSSTASWRCMLRGKDVIVFQRKFRRKIQTSQLMERLGAIGRSHFISIVKLIGISLSGDDYIYLVYEFVEGASLSECLRNPKVPNFTVLSTWMSRMQIATDVAHGLEYIHNNTGLIAVFVHNHLKGSGIIVTEPNFNAKICHMGTALLCGESDENDYIGDSEAGELKRSDSRRLQFEGVRGYMSPEFLLTGVATQKSDVHAFGVVILELLSGEEPLKFRYDKERKEFVKTSVIETAREAVSCDGDGGGGGVEGRIRKWVDKRLNDSFPADVAEKLIRLALECVDPDPDKRPDMSRVAVKVSKLYMQSKKWCDNIRLPIDKISVSIAPR